MLKLKSIVSGALCVAAAISLAGIAQACPGYTGQSSVDLPFKALKSEAAGKEANFKGNASPDSIVGLWKFAFIIKTPGGDVTIDAGYQTWHADGTELMNSGRPPIIGNICTGVWERTGPRTYKLNHYGISWDSSGLVRLGTDNIRLEVKLGPSGDTFTGTFAIQGYDTAGNPIPPAHVEGEVTATRVTVD